MSINSQIDNDRPVSGSIRICLLSLGCPKNIVDGEEMMGMLETGGFSLVPAPEDANLVVINTCAFIESAQREAIDEILSLVELKKAGDLRWLIVAGCLAERHGADLLGEISEIDAIIGPGQISKIGAVISQVVAGGRGITQTGSFETPTPVPNRVRTGSPYTAYVKISEGCSHHCTFCMIPQLRGPQRSRPLGSIAKEVRELASEGAQEIILVAQDTTAWGRDLPEKPDLPQLLHRLEAEEVGPTWLRILYGHVNYWTSELTDCFISGKRLLPYIDLPIQHIADPVLKRMGRRIKGNDIRTLLSDIRSKIPDVVLRTTILVGHPGEGEDEFSQLVEFLSEFPFDRLGAFAYSPEDGSPAAEFPDRPDPEVSQERLSRVLELQKEQAGVQRRGKIGADLEILIEGIDPERRYAIGRSYGEAPEIDGLVYVKNLESPDKVNPGDFMSVRIIGTGPYDYVSIPRQG